MRITPKGGRLVNRPGKLGVVAVSALALTFATGFGGSPRTTEPPDTEPVDSTEPAGTEAAGTDAADGGGDFVIGVSNTLAGNGWREEMICSVKAQALASGNVSEVIAI